MTNRLLCSMLVGLFTGAVAANARAAETGLELGGRLGYGLPFGSTSGGANSELSESASGMVPLWFDIGGRAIPELMIGGFFQVGVVMRGDAFDSLCDAPGIDCSMFDLRLGAQLQYHPLPFADTDPWFGAAIGYEWLTFGASNDGGDSVDLTVHGFEFVNLQGGVDFAVGPGSGVGPFVSFSLGQFQTVSTSSSDGDLDESEEIDDKALHQWLVLGVRGTFVL